VARVLVLFAHPALEKSRIHRRLVAAVPEDDRLTVNDLYEQYLRLDIDVAREQELLVEHDVVVFLFPFYWYSTPPILKQWQDLVLEHGWAYGSEGRALRGKTLICAVSTGGSEEAYRPEGYAGYSVRQFLAPIEQTSRLCGMRYLPPWLVSGVLQRGEPEIAQATDEFVRLIHGLMDDRFDPEDPTLLAAPCLNPTVNEVEVQPDTADRGRLI
jgi:glutathione-regulated potassium-efflux system ancillary protein KefG